MEGSLLRDTRRGVQLDKRRGHNNDAMVALLMAVDRMEHKPAPVKLVGWV